jgi:hypothetical protein
MSRIVLDNDGFGFAMCDNQPTADVASLTHPCCWVISGESHRQQHTEVSAFDYKMLEEREEVDGHLRHPLIHQERQRPAIRPGVLTRQLFQ